MVTESIGHRTPQEIGSPGSHNQKLRSSPLAISSTASVDIALSLSRAAPRIYLSLALRMKMVVRQALCRRATKASRPQCLSVGGARRGLAEPASGTFQYQVSDEAGIKFASRDLAGPTTTLALVAKAGTRYQPLPGLAEGLEKYAYRVCSTIAAESRSQTDLTTS